MIFAANHQSYMDVPAILSAMPARWRYRTAPAMRKEFFEAHFHGHSFTNSLNYYLSALFFNAFPIPQREPGALATLRYMGELANDQWCVLIFPEGKMTRQGEIAPFQPGVGMIAAKLGIPVVPDPDRRHGSSARSVPGEWRAWAGCGLRSARRSSSMATTIPPRQSRWRMRCERSSL